MHYKWKVRLLNVKNHWDFLFMASLAIFLPLWPLDILTLMLKVKFSYIKWKLTCLSITCPSFFLIEPQLNFWWFFKFPNWCFLGVKINYALEISFVLPDISGSHPQRVKGWSFRILALVQPEVHSKRCVISSFTPGMNNRYKWCILRWGKW
jgi:hypothetical protein